MKGKNMPTRAQKSAGKAAKKTVRKPAATTKKAVAKKTAGVGTKMKVKATARKSVAQQQDDTQKEQEKVARPARHFTPGSDLADAFTLMEEGGSDRKAVMHKIREAFKDRPTANGSEKPVSTIMNQVVHRAHELGYKIFGTWRIVSAEEYDTLQAEEEERMAAFREAHTPVKKIVKPMKKASKKTAKKTATSPAKKKATKGVKAVKKPSR